MRKVHGHYRPLWHSQRPVSVHLDLEILHTTELGPFCLSVAANAITLFRLNWGTPSGVTGVTPNLTAAFGHLG